MRLTRRLSPFMPLAITNLYSTANKETVQTDDASIFISIEVNPGKTFLCCNVNFQSISKVADTNNKLFLKLLIN